MNRDLFKELSYDDYIILSEKLKDKDYVQKRLESKIEYIKNNEHMTRLHLQLPDLYIRQNWKNCLDYIKSQNHCTGCIHNVRDYQRECGSPFGRGYQLKVVYDGKTFEPRIVGCKCVIKKSHEEQLRELRG